MPVWNCEIAIKKLMLPEKRYAHGGNIPCPEKCTCLRIRHLSKVNTLKSQDISQKGAEHPTRNQYSGAIFYHSEWWTVNT